MVAYLEQILIGDEPPFGGGFCPTHQMFLFDGDRPVWTIRPIDPSVDAGEFALIPRSPAYIRRDAYVLVALVVLKDPTVRRVLTDYAGSGVTQRRIDLDGWPDKGLCDLDAALHGIAEWPCMVAVDLDSDAGRMGAYPGTDVRC